MEISELRIKLDSIDCEIDILINELLSNVHQLDNSRLALESFMITGFSHSSYIQEDMVKNWLQLENINGQKVAHLEFIKKLKNIKEVNIQKLEDEITKKHKSYPINNHDIMKH